MQLSSVLSDILEEVPCPVCGGDDYAAVKKADYPKDLPRDEIVEIFRSSSDAVLMDQLVRCRRCGHLYLNPRFGEKTIVEAYAEGEDAKFAAQNEQRIKTFRRVFDRWARRRGVARDATTRVLDVGCAGGAFPHAARELGFSVVGVEPSRYLSEYARRQYGLDVRTGVLEEQGFAESSFEIVTLWDVIEHLPDPARTLREIHRILTRGGYLVVNYPDYASLPRKILGDKWPFFLSVHLSYFTPKSIERLLNAAGFDVLGLQRHYQTLELGYLMERAGGSFPVFKRLGRLPQALGIAHLPVTYYLGQTLVSAQKP